MDYQSPEDVEGLVTDQPADFISRDDMGLSVAYSPPRTDIERKLADIWSSVLQVSPVGGDDDFFELGGDSFAATVVASQIEAVLSAPFSPANIIHYSTVADQAAHLSEHLADENRDLPSFLVPCNANGTEPPFFLLHGGAGFTFFNPEFFEIVGEDQPVYMVQALGLDGRSAPCETVEEIAETYIKAIRQVQHEGPYRIGASCTGSFICLEICHQLNEIGQDVEKLILVDPPLRIAEKKFPKLRNLSELPGYPRLLRRWFRTRLATLMSQIDLVDHILKERNRIRKEKKRRRLLEKRKEGGVNVRSEEKAYNLDAMVDASIGLNQALKTYKAKDYNGQVYMLVTKARAFNASPDSLYSSKLKSITCKIIPVNHSSLFKEHFREMATFIKSALQS